LIYVDIRIGASAADLKHFEGLAPGGRPGCDDADHGGAVGGPDDAWFSAPAR